MNQVNAALRVNDRLNGAKAYTAAPGVIVLYGMVFDDKDRTLAEQTANAVNGVTQVIDNLRTKTGKWFQEEERINSQLLMNGFNDVQVRVVGPEVYLSGQVTSQAEKQRACVVLESADQQFHLGQTNPFMVKGMKPGESRSYTQRVRVDALDDPEDQKYTGVLNGTYTYVGTYQVKVPAGTFKTVLLRLKCEGKVGPADTHDSAYYFFAPGKGVVAMISQEDATAFWIIHIDTSSGKVLSSR
jgi:hypothetical protein